MNHLSLYGRTSGQFMRALAMAEGNLSGARAYAEGQQWSARDEITHTIVALNQQKSAVSALGTSTGLANTPVGVDFLSLYRPLPIIGQLPNVAKRPLLTRILVMNTGASAAIVGEGQAIPVSSGGYANVILTPQKITGITVQTADLLRVAESGTDQSLATDLANATALAEDYAFITPGTSGSILNGAPTVASTESTVAQIDADLEATVNALTTAGSTLAGATWLLSPKTAVHLSLLRSSGGSPAYPNVSVRGGELAGLPVVTSAAINGYVGLVDQSNIIVGEDEDVEITTSQFGSLEMLTNPTGNSLTPTGTSTVSLMQTDSVGIRSVIYRAWYGRPGAGVTLTGVAY